MQGGGRGDGGRGEDSEQIADVVDDLCHLCSHML